MQVLLGRLPLCTLESPEARAPLSFGGLGRLLWSAKRPLQTPNHPELLMKFRGIGCCDSNFTGPSHQPHLVVHNGNVYRLQLHYCQLLLFRSTSPNANMLSK